MVKGEYVVLEILSVLLMAVWVILVLFSKSKFKLPVFILSHSTLLLSILFITGIKTSMASILVDSIVPMVILLYLLIVRKFQIKILFEAENILYFISTVFLIFVSVFVFVLLPNAVSILDLR